MEAGSPKTAEVTDADIDALITDAMRVIARYVPNWSVKFITTTKDLQSYAIDVAHDDAVFVDWRGSTALDSDGVLGSEFNLLVGYNIGYEVELNVYRRYIEDVAKAQVREKYDWFFNEAEGKIYLVPAPSSTGVKVYYIGSKIWTVDSAPARFESYIVWYAASEVLKILARKRRRESAISHTGGTHVWSEADPTLADARTLEEKFLTAMRAESKKAMLFAK